MLRLKFLLLMLLTGTVASFGQEPRFIEEFEDVPCEDAMARLDLLFTQVTDEPGSIGAVLFYEGKYRRVDYLRNGTTRESWVRPTFGEVYLRMRWLDNYVNFRNFPKDRIRFVSAGYRNVFTIGLWVVPSGARPPKSTSTLQTIKYRKGKPTDFGCI